MASSPIDELVKQAIDIGAWKPKKDGDKTYYYNAKTKVTTWDLKKDFSKDPVKSAIDSGVWKEKKDGEKSYYYNAITKKTTWDLAKELGVGKASSSSAATTPASATNSEDPVAAALASGLWKEKKDPSSGKTYYYNTKTKETSWNLAKSLGVSAATTPSAAGDNDDPVAQALASGLWKEKKDPNSGKTYYYNTKTKETSWNLAKTLGVASASAQATPRAEDDTAPTNDAENQKAAEQAAAELEKKRLEEEAEEEKRKKQEREDQLAKELLKPKKKEEVWKPPPPPAFPPPPPQSRHPSSSVPVYDTSSRNSSPSSHSSYGIDPSKTGGWRNYSKTRWLEELDKRMGEANSPTRDQQVAAEFAATGTSATAEFGTSPMKNNNDESSKGRKKHASSSASPAKSAAMEMAAITGVISAQETLQELTTKTVDQKGMHQQHNTFVDFRDGACQTFFGAPTADVGVATLHAASNIAELIPIPDAGLMSCSTVESLKREQERALVLLQHVQGTLASQMQEAGVAFSGHGSTRQLRLNISKPKTGRNKSDETEAQDLAKELGPAYRSLQAPPSGPYWRFVTEHESNSLYDENSTRKAHVVQNLTAGTTQRHNLFDKISNDMRDQYVLREKMWGEYSRVNANSLIDVADFVAKTENDMRNQRMKEEMALAEKKAANKGEDDEDY